MKIAVTSKSFSKNEVLRNELLTRFQEVRFNDEGKVFTPESLADFLKDADRAIVGLEKINLPLLQRLPNLKLVSKYGVGLDNIDLAALREKNVQLSWTGGVNRRGVAELAISFMINLIRGVSLSHRNLLGGKWETHIGFGLREMKVGIVGLGHVGQELAHLLRLMGVEVVAHDCMDKSLVGFPMLPLNQLLAECDIVSLHIPHDDKTHHLFDETKLKMMKKGSFLINTARGGIVDEKALFQVLQQGHLRGAAFDVFAEEPVTSHALLALPNFLATPHIAGSAQESVLAMGRAAIEGLSGGKEAIRANFFNYP